MAKRVCVIGAGPSGVSLLKHFADVDPAVRPDIVCFERQQTWGGQWVYEWRTGTNEYGEPVHSSIYKNLWTNSPKEMTELPYYTFDEHFGKPYPSFLTRQDFWDYLNGAWTKQNLSSYIRFKTAVRFVKYNPETDDFRVTYTDLTNDHTSEETFTHVVVASGIYHIPNKPDFPGLAEFKGHVIHAHDLRDLKLYKGQRVLLIGNGFTSTDLALMGVKYGAENMTVTWRTKPTPIRWPDGISVRPLVERVESRKVHFFDGSSDEFDSIILCTGYQVKFPFMDKDLRIGPRLTFCPRLLYKGVLFTKGGNNKLFYIAANVHVPGLPMLDVQSLWICRYIQGMIAGEPLSNEDMTKDITEWMRKAPEFSGNLKDGIICNFELMRFLANILEYNNRFEEMLEMTMHHFRNFLTDPMGCRDVCYKSAYTGTLAAEPDEKWSKEMVDHV